MSTLAKQIRQSLGVVPSIDPAAETERRVNFLVDYARATGTAGYVLGISGGQDSTLAGRLAQLAVEQLRHSGHEARLYALRLPYKVQQDEADARRALDFVAADEELTINIGGGTDALTADVAIGLGEDVTDFNKGNVKARMRMVGQYAVAAQRRALVIGTDQAAEAVSGFFTKYGDGAADVVPLAGLTKRQVSDMLAELGAAERLYTKVPTADLLVEDPGQTDESSLGLSYWQIDDYLEGRDVAAKVSQQIEARYLASRHKRRLPVGPDDEWWRD